MSRTRCVGHRSVYGIGVPQARDRGHITVPHGPHPHPVQTRPIRAPSHPRPLPSAPQAPSGPPAFRGLALDGFRPRSQRHRCSNGATLTAPMFHRCCSDRTEGLPPGSALLTSSPRPQWPADGPGARMLVELARSALAGRGATRMRDRCCAWRLPVQTGLAGSRRLPSEPRVSPASYKVNPGGSCRCGKGKPLPSLLRAGISLT